jgi:hypothetical protein
VDDDLEALGQELRRLPTPVSPDALVSRVRALAHRELAEQADERLNSVVLTLVLVFSWSVTVVSFFAVRVLRAGAGDLLGIAMGSTLSWSAAWFAAAWMSGAAVIALVGFHRRREGRLA